MDGRKLSLSIFVLVLLNILKVMGGGELGSVECLQGKWKVDTRLMALVMTCPLPLDGNPASIMKLVKCAMNKLGVYDGESLSEDFLETACSLFSQQQYKEGCMSHGGMCSLVLGSGPAWETGWPLFMGCFTPWVMTLCNI